MKSLFILLIFIIANTCIYSIELNFKYYQVEDGLSSNTVYDIIQDAEGYIWVGTEDGLNRFDGYDFRYYRNIPRDTTSIVSNYVYKLLEHSDGNIWVGTERGVCIYHPQTGIFTPFHLRTSQGVTITDRIQGLIPDDNGRLWIASTGQGVFLYDQVKNELKQYSFESYRENQFVQLYTTCIFKDRDQTVWALVNGTIHQIYKLNPLTDTFEPAFSHITPDKLKKLSSYCMLEDTFGVLWLGTWNNGIFAVDKTTGVKANYLNTEGVDKILHIHSIMEYEPGKLYIGSNEGLISFIGTPVKGYKMEEHIRDPILSNCFVYPIYKDREGGLWIGTYYGGINYASSNRNYFTGYTHHKYCNSVSGNVISAFCEDKAGCLWIGTDDGGLNYFNTKTEHFTTYKPEKNRNSLSFHNIHALCMDGNELWIGTYTGGLNVMDLSTKRFRHYVSNTIDTTTLSSNSIYALYKDTCANIWVGTMAGINLYDRTLDTFRRIKEYYETTTDILQVGDRVWFATNGNGLLSYHLGTQEWKHYVFDSGDLSSLISNNVMCLCLDDQGQLWVGTISGLCRYEPGCDAFVLPATGFENSSICKLFSDDGHLWITTTKGLIDYDPRLNRIRVFTREDGLTSEQFTVNSGIKTRNGKIYAGTTNGFNAFYPKQIVVNRHVPQIRLTDFQLFNKSVELRDYMEKDNNGEACIVLAYNQNSFGFDFTALSYFAPEKNEYAFYLEGFDKEWNYVGKKRKATYTNIPPGKYAFRIRASNNDRIWNTEGISVRLIITPPFWLTGWFIALYILMGVGTLLGLYIYVRKRDERRNNARMEQIKNEQEKESYNSKINFFTTIAHEIRTPVSLIIGPLEKIIDRTHELPEKIKDDLNIINRNSQRLLFLVNQLLDFRKIETGTLPISFSDQCVHELLMNVYIRFKSYAENKEVRLSYVSHCRELSARVDVENLTKAVSNLLNNALKFTKDTIEMTLEKDDNTHTFRISVRDNGCGIPKEQQEHILKPFYQIPGAGSGGTGLGLYLVKSIVDSCQGTLEIQSEPGNGSTFTIIFPVGQAQSATDEAYPVGMFTDSSGTNANNSSEQIPAPADPAEEQQTLLIVEDNSEMIDFLCKTFKEEYCVLTAANGVKAIEILEREQVDLIISDIMMPEMDGIAFCNRVKSSFLWNHIPVILLTAKTTIAAKIEAMEKGADAYVDKPFSISFLYARVRNLLESRKNLLRKYTKTPYSSLKSIAGNKDDEAFLVRVNEIIERHISDVDFTMDQLAGELHISSSGLFARIKNLSGITPNKLLMLVRLKKATELLSENKYRINEVCYKVGFNNPSYFAKCFQKQYGVLPKDFIRTNAR